MTSLPGKEERAAGRGRQALVAAVAAVLSAVVPAAAPSAAAASTVSVEAGVMLVVAGPGEVNDVLISPRGGASPSDFAVEDSAGATAGPGCRSDPPYSPRTVGVCAVAGVQRIVVRLGDGDDRTSFVPGTSVPIEVYGEAGRDDISTPTLASAGTLADGGDGDDTLSGGELQRGGPGNDFVTGTRRVEGGDGDDQLFKSSPEYSLPGVIDAGSGDDRIWSEDTRPDVVSCGSGRDRVATADDGDRPDATCESGKGVAVVRAVTPVVTVFELPGGRSRPGSDGRLAVWMRCTVPACAVTVQLRFAGEFATPRFVRFPGAPTQRLVVGTTARLFRLPLSRAQRRGLRRAHTYDGVGAVVIANGPTGRSSQKTDGLHCRRSSPCGDGPPAGQRGPRPGERAREGEPARASRSFARGRLGSAA